MDSAQDQGILATEQQLTIHNELLGMLGYNGFRDQFIQNSSELREFDQRKLNVLLRRDVSLTLYSG